MIPVGSWYGSYNVIMLIIFIWIEFYTSVNSHRNNTIRVVLDESKHGRSRGEGRRWYCSGSQGADLHPEHRFLRVQKRPNKQQRHAQEKARFLSLYIYIIYV